jgi:hypothetical protein
MRFGPTRAFSHIIFTHPTEVASAALAIVHWMARLEQRHFRDYSGNVWRIVKKCLRVLLTIGHNASCTDTTIGLHQLQGTCWDRCLTMQTMESSHKRWALVCNETILYLNSSRYQKFAQGSCDVNTALFRQGNSFHDINYKTSCLANLLLCRDADSWVATLTSKACLHPRRV